MGVNAFVQFAVPYLIDVRGWSAPEATLVLIVTFVVMPIARLAYAHFAGYVGDYGSLLIGHGLYFIFIVLLVYGSGPVALLAMGCALGLAGALVFMAGPLQIMGLAEKGDAGRMSGSFFATNFFAWVIAIPAYGALIKWQGLAIGPLAAAAVTAVGAAACAMFTPRAKPVRATVVWGDFMGQLTAPSIRFLVLLTFIAAFSFGFMFGTFATFVTAVYGAATISLLGLGFYLSRLPSSLIAGLAADRYGPNLTLAVTFAIAAIAIGVTAWRFEISTLVLAVVALGSVQAAVPVVGTSTVTVNAPVHLRPIAYAPIMGAGELGVAATLGLGLLLRNASPNPAPFLGIVSAAYLACFVLLVVRKPLGEHTRLAKNQ